jgi:sulfur-oxidizing protein SoxY
VGTHREFLRLGIVIGLIMFSGPGFGRSAWDDIRGDLFGARPIEAGQGVATLKAPYRALDQRFVPISIEAALTDGRQIEAVTVIVDDNPSPVAAAFHFADHRERAALSINIRLDEESAVRVIIEASDRRLYMTATFIKASGLGVCAAPPVSDQQAAAQVIGQMRLTDLTNDESAAATQLRRRAQLDVKHPQNTGLQMNQVTMMFIPLRFITRIEVRQADQVIWTMDGGMTLSENPRIAFDYWVNGAGRLRVRAEDTRHAVWEQSFPIGSSS